jgi:hypothetical protein
MKLKSLGTCSALALTLAAVACEKKTPSSPSELNASTQTTSVTDAVTGITLTTPIAVTPTNNQQFKNVEQPVTLTVRNAVSTGTTALTYSFEVATDVNFGNRVYTKDTVAEGGGQTSLKIDRIAPDKTYYWRARANSGSQVGPNSAPRSFTIGPEVILQTPVLVSPANNGQASGSPTFIVANVGRTGPAGQVLYRFEISTSNTFSPLAVAQTVTEQGGGQTSFTYNVPANTPAGNYFWRVQASDPSNGVTSPFSSTFQFRYQPFDMRNIQPRGVRGGFRPARWTGPVARPLVRRRRSRNPPVHAGDVREPQREPVVLLGRRPILVRTRAVSVDAAILCRQKLVLRWALVADCRLPAFQWRDRRFVRRHR